MLFFPLLPRALWGAFLRRGKNLYFGGLGFALVVGDSLWGGGPWEIWALCPGIGQTLCFKALIGGPVFLREIISAVVSLEKRRPHNFSGGTQKVFFLPLWGGAPFFWGPPLFWGKGPPRGVCEGLGKFFCGPSARDIPVSRGRVFPRGNRVFPGEGALCVF